MFWVFLTSFTGDGFYEESDIVVEKGAYNGVLMPAGNLSAEIPVSFKMEYKSGDTYQTVAAGFDSLQGLLEKFPNVVMCVNCFLNPKIDLPMEKPQNGMELAGCELYPRLFPVGFPLGKYYIHITHKCDELGEAYCGSIRVDFELKAKAED
ncbi:Protein of unknown function [Gryllus bimaculatus]|nr:Protein of unknown function [Gryllus bimaculatus]